ncbi:MAG: hypothetical protein Q9195_000979 [Heterodermia aff. obscurata]
MTGADANIIEADEARPRINHHPTDNLVPARTPASRQRRNKRGKGENKNQILSKITDDPQHPTDMEDNIANLGVLANVGHDFCPYAAVAKLPYKYIDKANLQPVSDAYFAGGQFRARGWTLYYIHPHLDASSKPLILVPALEVEALLYDINKDFSTSYKMPSPNKEPGFLLNFDKKGSPRPRYLGRVDADISVEDMESKIPAPGFKANGETEVLEDRSFAAFKAKMEAAIQAGKNKTKSQRERKKKERIASKQTWCDQLKRTQCYLGLRPRRGSVAKQDPLSDGKLNWAEYQEAQKAYDISRSANLPDLDDTKPVPYSLDKNVVFVCVDVEAWEKDQSIVTEIGVSTLDTNDLTKLPPGEGGKNWMTAIRPRHFRITEHRTFINQEFIAGCADRFEKDFGTSSFISIKEAPQVIASCFREPFSASYRMKSNTVPGTSDSLNHALNQEDPHTKRNIVLVGHDIRSDINYMRQIGYDVSNLSNLLEAIDTADMFKALKHEQQSRSLGAVLLELEMVGWNLHNAGNDAAYTLQAMIGVAFAGRQDKQRYQAIAETERARVESAAQDAEDRIVEENEEWDAADIDGDGGLPVSIPRPEDDRHKGPKGKFSPKVDRAAQMALPKQKIKNVKTKEEAFASAFEIGKAGGKKWQENNLIDLEGNGSKTSTGLFVHNMATQDEVLDLFPQDEQRIIGIENHGKARWSVHFSTHEEAKTALDRQPEERKTKGAVSKVPGQPRKPNVRWFDEFRRAGTGPRAQQGGAGSMKKNVKSRDYKPVTEWGPQSTSHENSEVAKPAMTVKDLSARMKARVAVLESPGDGDDGGARLV